MTMRISEEAKAQIAPHFREAIERIVLFNQEKGAQGFP